MNSAESALPTSAEAEHSDDPRFKHFVGHLDDLVEFLENAHYVFFNGHPTVLVHSERLRASILRTLNE